MRITLSPVRQDGTLTASLAGDVLTLNGVEFDFSPLPEGATLPATAIDSDWLTGPVSRIDGELHLTLRLPHGPSPSRAVALPESIHATGDGPIRLPFDTVAEPEPMPVVEPEPEMTDAGALQA